MSKSVSRGRPKGGSDARERIRAAARGRFLAGGYHDASLRSIADEANVDVALVSYYFGSKRELFGAAMALPVNPAEMLAAELEGDLDGLAERVLTGILAVWDDPASGEPLAAMGKLVLSDPMIGRLVAEMVSGELVGTLAARLPGPGATERASAFSALVSGVIFSRYLLAVEPFASADPAEVVRRVAPSLQLALTGP
jgi:AcrR family transcriptional regulator